MISLKVKIKSEASTFTETHFLDDNFNVCKTNEKLQKLVEDTVKRSHLEVIEDVKVTASFEW